MFIFKIFPATQLGTPWKIHMEPKNGGLVEMIFLFNQVIFKVHDNFPGCSVGSYNKPL